MVDNPIIKKNIHQAFDEICRDISKKGISVYKACEDRGFRTHKFYDLIERSPELARKYMFAVWDRGDHCLDRINGFMAEVYAGKLDPATARVLIDTEKWKAAKFYPKMYGDKTMIDIQSKTAVVQRVYVTKEQEKRIDDEIERVIEASLNEAGRLPDNRGS